MERLSAPIITPAPVLTRRTRRFFGPLQPRQGLSVGVGIGPSGVSASASVGGEASASTSPTDSTSDTGATSLTDTGTSTGTSSDSTTSTQSDTTDTTTTTSSTSSSSSSSSSSSTSTSSTSSSSSLTPTTTSSTSSATSTVSSTTTTSSAQQASSSSSSSSSLISSSNGVSSTTPIISPSADPALQSPDTSSRVARTAIITGSTVGGVLLLVLLIVLGSLFCWKRRKNRKLGFLQALVNRSKEGKGAGGVGLLDGEFDEDDEYRDEMHMRDRSLNSSHSPQPSLTGSQQNNSPYNTAPQLYRARASDSGSMFHEEGVWPPPNHGSQFVDPFVPARELERNSDLSNIVDQVMGSGDELQLGAAPAIVSGAAAMPDYFGHAKSHSGSSTTTPKRPSPLAQSASSSSPPPSPTPKPKNWLERSPRNTMFTPPPLSTGNGAVPPAAFANSASSLVNSYGIQALITSPVSTTPKQKHVSWSELPTISRPTSRPPSRQS